MTALESPRRPMRRMHRTRVSFSARLRASALVPSGLSSSTKMISQSPAGSAASIPATIAPTLPLSL